MSKTSLQTLKGFRDFLPKEARKRQYLIKKSVEVLEFYGFDPLETPTLEYQEVLLGKYGDSADKLVFKFEDEGKRQVALRYDQTVPTARVLAQYQQSLPLPFKRYQVQSAFRAEKPQKGRFREFLQLDADIFGAPPPLPDAEILSVIWVIYQNLGLKSTLIKVNDRQQLFQTLIQAGIPKDKQFRTIQIIDKLDKKSAEEVSRELAGVVDLNTAKKIFATFDQQSPSQETAAIIQTAQKLGVPKSQIKFVPYLARGLDYYTGMIVEVVVPEYSGGSVLGGGRYDQLINQLSGNKVDLAAVGFAIGVDRTIEAMDALELFPITQTSAKALITIFSENLADESLALAVSLRNLGIAVELYPQITKLDKQLKFADKKGIPFAIIVGQEEADKKQVTLKDLAKRTQVTIPLDKLVAILKR